MSGASVPTPALVAGLLALVGCTAEASGPVPLGTTGDAAATHGSGAQTTAAMTGESGSGGAPGTEGGQTGTSASGSGGSTGGTSGPSGDGVRCEAGGWGNGGDDAPDDDGAEESEFGMGDDIPLSVYQVQQDAANDGDGVLLSDVLVTSPPSAGEALGGLEFFVQELAGGPFSGLRIQTMDESVAAIVEPGATLDLRGEIARHMGYYILRVDGAQDVTPTGTATAPPPPVVAAADLDPELPDARQYEGVVVRVDRGTVTDPEPCDGEFTLDDVVRVDDRFVPDAIASPAAGEVIPTVEGVVVFALDGYELAPTAPLTR